MHTATEHALSTREAADNSNIYAVDHIFCHMNTKDGTRYIVRWYGYTTAEDTAEPSNNIPDHFIKSNSEGLTLQRLTCVNVNETKNPSKNWGEK